MQGCNGRRRIHSCGATNSMGTPNCSRNVVAERLKPNRYYRVEASDIQGLNSADTPEKEPTVLPHVFYEKVRPGLRPGQRIKTEISAIQVDNDDQHDLSRWVGNVEMHDEIKTGRVVTDLRAGAIASYYSIQKKPSSATTKTDDLGRVTPQLSAGWRMPLALPASIDQPFSNRRCSWFMSAGRT